LSDGEGIGSVNKICRRNSLTNDLMSTGIIWKWRVSAGLL
jgi:hypothetical protein